MILCKTLISFVICLAFLFSFNLICPAQNEADSTLIPFKMEEKWGFINNKGKIVIKPQFDEADKFSEGLARVQIGLKSGYINSSGKFIIEPIYTFAFSFSEGLAVVGENMDSRWFYIDHQGKTVIEANPKFIWLGPFQNGLAQFSTNIGENTTNTYDARNGFFDKTGNIVIEPKFTDAENFSDGLAMVAEDKKREDGASGYFNRKSFMDTKGNIVTPFYERAENFSEGLAAVYIENRWGFIDKTGNIVIAPQFDFVLREFSEGIAFVHCDNEKIAAINKSGKYITQCIFDEAWGFSEGLSAVQLNGEFGFINSKGRFIIKPQFDYAESFYNGLAEVKIIKDDWIYAGFIDNKGKYIFAPVKYEKRDS